MYDLNKIQSVITNSKTIENHNITDSTKFQRQYIHSNSLGFQISQGKITNIPKIENIINIMIDINK
ncbi:MAG: hypothetical protein LBU14_02570 [Candidatus Peribacteria bacterium]|nr:hypothetical protein [Candidatus Peribacteria bacterium]